MSQTTTDTGPDIEPRADRQEPAADRRPDQLRVPVFRAGWRVGVFRSRLWAATWLSWLVFFVLPLIAGWLNKLAFDALERSGSIRNVLIAIGVTEAARWVVFSAAIWFVVRWWQAGITMLRTNMLDAQTVSGGPKRASLPLGPAEAISSFQDDARDVLLWTDSWLDGLGFGGYAVGALVIMATIDGRAALVALVPLLIVTAIVVWLRPKIYLANEADRDATGVITGFLGETFAGTLAFKLAGREGAAVSRLERHTDRRRATAVRAVTLEEALVGLASTTSELTVGLMLLVLVPRVNAGDIGVGDLALFVSYSAMLGEVPRFLARLITSREQARVAVRRMARLVPPDRVEDLWADAEVTIERREPMRVRSADPARMPIDHLSVRGLTALHDSTGGGIRDVDLDIERGQFVVVTGPVGAGKSTLLRALIGLDPIQGGIVTWNGHEIDDLGAWFVPPNAAYLPQVPRLFSESLTDNIALGRPTDRLGLVVETATLGPDLAQMPDGLATVVGARGLRLSGGQAQRVATARSLLTGPELLVVDDLSSALDVETERTLWRRVRDDGTTVLAVSHRPFVLQMADEVIEL